MIKLILVLSLLIGIGYPAKLSGCRCTDPLVPCPLVCPDGQF